MTIYQIKLPQFEGPFDLLLFFIERDEIDIYDIPIAQLTNDFLDYIHQLELLNIELASEFIVVAATLMNIKSRMLLPRKELNEQGEEIDPREELVQRLLEYKQFKDVIADLQTMEEDRQKRYKRGNLTTELQYIGNKFSTEAELESLDLYKLLAVFNKVLARYEDQINRKQYAIITPPYTIGQQKEFLTHFIRIKKDVPFDEVFQDCDNRLMAIFRFLAILEMVQEQLIALRLGMGINNFWLVSAPEPTPESENMPTEI